MAFREKVARARRGIVTTWRGQVLERDLSLPVDGGEARLDVTWRAATPEDIESLTWEDLRYDEFRKRNAIEMLGEGSICMIAEHEGQVAHIGWISFNRLVAGPVSQELGPGWAYFYDTRTPDRFRGMGLQKAGIKARVEHARSLGHLRGVNVVDVTNAISLHNYESMGFRRVAQASALRVMRRWVNVSVPGIFRDRVGSDAATLTG
jgi:ribosomal protein S18 acetylase RimI-like enzyme